MNTQLLEEVKQTIEIALKEDDARHDWTSISCFPDESQAKAKLILKEDARIAGLIFLPLIAHAVDPKIEIELHVKEGEDHFRGTTLAMARGPVKALLAMERTALNFIQHVSGIATTTARYARAIKDLPCKILDTRKTLPGLRYLQKYGVKMGGGANHRFQLSEQILIKDNHLAHLKKEGLSPIREAIKRSRELHPDMKVEIEVSNLEELKEAILEKPDAILLDNMAVSDTERAVQLSPEGIFLEASGGIHIDNIRLYAETGVHGISIGRLTHSVQAIDMSLKIYSGLNLQ